MAWNPEKYNEFKSVRYKPFFDVVNLIEDKPDMKVIDLGCGTGELTNMLLEKLSNPYVKGIDSSAEMLKEANQFDKIIFEKKTIGAQMATGEKWDLVFSNAALQWVENHQKLFPEIIKLLNPGGQLAVQMPSQNENSLNQILIGLVQEQPFSTALHYWKQDFPLLTVDEYAQLLFENGGTNIQVYQKVYPLIVDSQDELYEFISGSALVPYFEKLDGNIKEQFITEFKSRIAKRFPNLPALYAFKRIIFYAKF